MVEVLNSTAAKDTRILAHIGSPVVVACRMTEAYTGGNLQVYWSTLTTPTANFSFRRSPTVSHLVINTVYRENTGIYSCHAANDLGDISIALNLLVGSAPDPFTITVTSDNTTLTVEWEDNAVRPSDENIIAYYVQYRAVNGSSAYIVVEKFAASVRQTTFREVEQDVEYLVNMWSENLFGNSSATNEVSVVINGKYG